MFILYTTVNEINIIHQQRIVSQQWQCQQSPSTSYDVKITTVQYQSCPVGTYDVVFQNIVTNDRRNAVISDEKKTLCSTFYMIEHCS